jgi:biopolymer transport protein ExbD
MPAVRAWALVVSVMVVGCEEPAPRPLAPGDPGSIVSRSIPMDPPATQVAEDLVILVAIADDGAITLDGEPVAPEALGARVTARMVGQPPEHTRALLSAAPGTTHAQVVAVLDAIRRAGVTRFAIDIPP